MFQITPKKPSSSGSSSLLSSSKASTDSEYMAFALLHNKNRDKYSIESGSDAQKGDVLDKLTHFCEMTWTQIKLQAKNKSGCETIPIEKIKQRPPSIVTPEIKEYLVIRCLSQTARIVGVRIGRTFEVIWFDPDLSLYDHD